MVADEVRNLAGKSAAAAQETNELIARSVQAVAQGEGLAQSTADALAAAAATADGAVHTVEQVTRDYQSQAAHLRDISTGVDQISNVVQTNSATAEESAAASQELAGQAESMQHQIALFHLQEDLRAEQASFAHSVSPEPQPAPDPVPASELGWDDLWACAPEPEPPFQPEQAAEPEFDPIPAPSSSSAPEDMQKY